MTVHTGTFPSLSRNANSLVHSKSISVLSHLNTTVPLRVRTHLHIYTYLYIHISIERGTTLIHSVTPVHSNPVAVVVVVVGSFFSFFFFYSSFGFHMYEYIYIVCAWAQACVCIILAKVTAQSGACIRVFIIPIKLVTEGFRGSTTTSSSSSDAGEQWYRKEN